MVNRYVMKSEHDLFFDCLPYEWRLELDLEFKGHHRAERVQIAEVPCVWYLIGWIARTFDYINRITKCFRFWSTRVRRHTLPARCYASPR